MSDDYWEQEAMRMEAACDELRQEVAQLREAATVAVKHLRGRPTKFSERDAGAVAYQLEQALAAQEDT